MSKQYNIGCIPVPVDNLLAPVKQILIQYKIISEEIPDSQIADYIYDGLQLYISEYKHYETYLTDIKSVLVQYNFISEDCDISDIAGVLPDTINGHATSTLYLNQIKQILQDNNIINSSSTIEDIIPAVNSIVITAIKQNQTWGDININEYTCMYYPPYSTVVTHPSKQYCYGIGKGVFYMDLQTGEETLLHSTSPNFIYLLSTGDCLIGHGSNNASNDGLYVASKSLLYPIYEGIGNWYRAFEDSRNNIYVSRTASNTGLYVIRLDDLNTPHVQQISTTGYYYTNFYETPDGTIYCSSNTYNNYGLYKIDKDYTVSRIHDTSYNWRVAFCANDGRLFFKNTESSSSITRVLELCPDGTISVFSISASAVFFNETSTGDIYLSTTTTSSSYYGIFLIKDHTCTRIYSTGTKWSSFIEINPDELYFSSTGGDGILSIKQNTVTPIITKGSFSYLIENGEYIIATSTLVPNDKDFIAIDKNTNTIYSMIK